MAYMNIIGACVLPNVGGWVGSLIVRKNYTTWYKDLKKPDWNPPSWVFGPVWTSLYSGMGYASYLVWRDGGGFQGEAALPLALYASQLALNWAWTPMFFGLHWIKAGLVDIVLMTGLTAATAVTFSSINKAAGVIMVPYLGWLMFAGTLNFSILQLQKKTDKPSAYQPKTK